MASFSSVAIGGTISQAAPQFGSGSVSIQVVLPSEPFFFGYGSVDSGPVQLPQEPIANTQQGALMPMGDDITKFVMRGFKTTPTTGFIYWESFVDPDPLGYLAPVPRAQLTDIVVVSEITGV